MYEIKGISIYILILFFVTACSDDDPGTSGTVSVTMTLDQLPSAITYNRAETPEG